MLKDHGIMVKRGKTHTHTHKKGRCGTKGRGLAGMVVMVRLDDLSGFFPTLMIL